ncbi:phage tail sheath C-terminal domain-containing protein [Streptomyces griseorubiginosus]|uniref:phage tail sheath C-terminal domain-containing protein n=1 Tax=Streptomyces griseorubiginosus TaxID=67304 RepID=UPI0036EF9159
MTAGLRLGAPGVYQAAPRAEERSPRPVRLDVAGFAGVAPRGPVDLPVLVRDWSEYRRRFGGYEGPGLLPYAVSVFFAQGGERAYVVRVGPRDLGEDDGRAHFSVETGTAAGTETGLARFAARDWGTWGDRLTLRIEHAVTWRFVPAFDPADALPPGDGRDLPLPRGTDLPPGTLLRLRGPGLASPGEFRWVERAERRVSLAGRPHEVAVLDRPLPGNAVGMTADVVTAAFTVDDGDLTFPRREEFTGLGLRPEHPRFLGRVLGDESLLVSYEGPDAPLPPSGPLLPTMSVARRVRDGRDRYAEVTGEAFFDGPPGDPPDADPLDERPHHGADLLARNQEIGLLAVPDLLWSWAEPAPVPDPWPDSPPDPCAPPLPTSYADPAPRMTPLDARDPADLVSLTERQRHLAELAEHHRRFTVLLDVPPGLDNRGIARWRTGFDTAFAAAYHPWLDVMGPGGTPRSVPPSAFAAGIVAARERRLGLSWGPANETARGAVRAAVEVSHAEHDTLFAQAVNVCLGERDGFRLASARTLASAPEYRQLSVRRLMTMLRLTLERQSQWIMFEPLTAGLRERLRHTLEILLLDLYRRGAFTGATEEEAFFVRTGDDVNPPHSLELGRVVAEVGVAPAEPLEFLLLRISGDGEGGVRVEEAGSDDDS